MLNNDNVVYKGVPPEVQRKIVKLSELVLVRGKFARSTGSRLVLMEMAVSKREKDGKLQATVTYEITVDEDMTNIAGNMHGGCAVYLIDICSSVALAVLAEVMGKPSHFVSQALNTTFHAPAPAGVTLEIVNRTVALGGRTVSTITEIWDVTNKRLCMTGVHNKMAPSQPKL